MNYVGKRMLAVASLVGGAALLLGACGGATPTATPVSPTATTRPQPTATSAASQATATTAAPTATATARPQATATGSAQATPTAAPTARPTATAAPSGVPAFPQAKAGGMLLRRTPGDPPGWDGHQNRTDVVQDILQTMYDQLVQMDPYNQSAVVPQLAQGWKVSDDGLTWTFTLNKGVKFHDGSPLTAQDVAFTYDKVVLNPPKGLLSAFAGDLLALQTATATDDATLVLKLKGPDASFLSSLGQGRMAIYSKAQVESGGRERTNAWPPIGSGPFKAKEYIRGISTELVKNPDYFVAGRPFLNGIKFFVIPDDGTYYAAFLAGQINFGTGTGFTPQQKQELQTRLGSRVTIQTTPTLTWRDVLVNGTVKPFDDVRVRQAMAYALDKVGVSTAMNEPYALGGFLAPGTGWELPDAELKTFPGFDPDVKANIAKAKKLLADAGYPNGFKTAYYTRNHPVYINITQPVQALLKEIGITGDIQIVDTAKYFEVNVPKNPGWQVVAGGLRSSGIDPNAAYREFILSTGPRSFLGLDDPKVKQLYDAQNIETDPAKRKQKAWDMERYVLNLQPIIPLYYNKIDYAWYASIKNFQYHINYGANVQMRDVWIE